MMATKSKPLSNGMHTAGIFADLTVDGPDIGTLVAIVDRAKNLPNRKTIGKQDPYCAARLGKEAKKTATDVRGGQTPRWDQELRFIVHDSPDYYQLKVSVFNDDKKTDLIGEAWVDLRDIIITGGGQSDQWHTLSCKGKYAGELRMEITYYDTRPKPEKPAAKPKPVASEPTDGSISSRGPVKRRPLPSDPVTGEVPVQPAEHASTPPRALPRQPSGYIPNQSPLQSVEYGTPPAAPRHQHSDSYGQANGYGTPPGPREMSSQPHTPRSVDRHDGYGSRHDDREYSPRHPSYHPSAERAEGRGHYQQRSDQYDVRPSIEDYSQELPGDDETPPPPPVHRSRHSSAANSQDMGVRGSFDSPPKNTPPMRHDILKQEAHRRAPSYPGRPSYRGHDSAPARPMPSPGEDSSRQPSPPRYHSYDNGRDQYRSMQPTVEDVPESPTPARGKSRTPQYDSQAYESRPYDKSASPAPLNLNRGSSVPVADYHNTSPQPVHPAEDFGRPQPSVSPMSQRELTHSPGEISQPSHSSAGHHPAQRSELHGVEIQAYGYTPVPPSLVPGVDPAIASEVSDRIYEERRQDRRYSQQPQQQTATPPRGRQQIEHHGYTNGGSSHHQASQSYDARAMVRYSSDPPPAPQNQLVHARSVSPIPPQQPGHFIKRKSVSPAPPPADPSEGPRRMSAIPFGPDSYDALNPSVSSEKDAKVDPDAPIIDHDGREIDPSDHLPMDTWAPEPDKKPGNAPADSRVRPGGAQPMPTSGRRPLRIAGRPHSSSPAAASPSHGGMPDAHPVTPGNAGRNRLQKRGQRASALPPPAGPNGSSPLAPISNHQDMGSGFTPPRMSRASTWDYPNENHAPQYGSSPGAHRGSAPPIPAKVPLPMMSGGLSSSHGGEDMALMEEMSRIDIGAGRSRRHGGY